MGSNPVHLLLFLIGVIMTGTHCRDLTLEPGHLQPYGHGRPGQPVPEIEGFPSPNEFFTNNVTPLRPVKMKGAAKLFPAFLKWTDEYFLSLDEPMDHSVAVETVKKESRDQNMLHMHFKEFVDIYNDSEYYMVNPVPPFIRNDVVLPCPLQCKSIVEKNLADNVMWFSSGGTNSVVHTDSFDNINCLLRGNKTLVLVDPDLYKDNVDIDHPEGSYSDVDVDRVDYLKYPGLADVEFYHVNVTAGDCLYIPYKWIHQVRSYGSNLAINVWWHHYLKEDIDFGECNDVCDPGLTLMDGVFNHNDTGTMSPEEVRDHFLSLISLSKPLDFPRFVGKLLSGMSVEDLDQNEGMKTGLMHIFTLVDLNKDGIVTKREITDTSNEAYEEVWNIMSFLEGEVDDSDDNITDSDMVHEESEDGMDDNAPNVNPDNFVESVRSLYTDDLNNGDPNMELTEEEEMNDRNFNNVVVDEAHENTDKSNHTYHDEF